MKMWEAVEHNLAEGRVHSIFHLKKDVSQTISWQTYANMPVWGICVEASNIYVSLANWYTYPTDSCYSPGTPKEKWVQRGGSCVCFSVLMNNRQMKRTYSGSSCANVLVLHNLWFVPKSKLCSSFGVFSCHHCQWLMAVAQWMPAWASGLRYSEWGSAACPSLAWSSPLPPHPRQLQLLSLRAWTWAQYVSVAKWQSRVSDESISATATIFFISEDHGSECLPIYFLQTACFCMIFALKPASLEMQTLCSHMQR